MTFDKLVKAKAKIDAEIELRAAKDRTVLIEAIHRVRKTLRVAAKVSLSARTHARKGKKQPPLYRNPKNHDETWAGRGRRPGWLAAALKRGMKLHSFAIK
jgi:DNA-binding protein H-NS